jgi:hypothetical protein
MEGIALGIFIGIGFTVFGKKLYRPAVKGTIKAGLAASEAVEEAIHEGKEVLSDLVAEAKQESAAARSVAAARPEEPKGQASN